MPAAASNASGIRRRASHPATLSEGPGRDARRDEEEAGGREVLAEEATSPAPAPMRTRAATASTNATAAIAALVRGSTTSSASATRPGPSTMSRQRGLGGGEPVEDDVGPDDGQQEGETGDRDGDPANTGQTAGIRGGQPRGSGELQAQTATRSCSSTPPRCAGCSHTEASTRQRTRLRGARRPPSRTCSSVLRWS